MSLIIFFNTYNFPYDRRTFVTSKHWGHGLIVTVHSTLLCAVYRLNHALDTTSPHLNLLFQKHGVTVGHVLFWRYHTEFAYFTSQALVNLLLFWLRLLPALSTYIILMDINGFVTRGAKLLLIICHVGSVICKPIDMVSLLYLGILYHMAVLWALCKTLGACNIYAMEYYEGCRHCFILNRDLSMDLCMHWDMHFVSMRVDHFERGMSPWFPLMELQ